MNQESGKITKFTDLTTWQKGHQLVLLVYKTTANFPEDEKFGLASQMKHSAASFTSNIAEGFGRKGYQDKVRFYYMAQGSLIELKNQLLIAKDVGYLTVSAYNQLSRQSDTCHKLLQGLIKKSKTLIKET